MTGRWLWLVVLGLTSCTRDLCENVDCRRPATATCVGDSQRETTSGRGTCEPSTGECWFPKPKLEACATGERCTEGVCACVPSECAGCCRPGGGCVSPAGLSPSECGAAGAECSACGPGSICGSEQACVSCPPRHVVRFNRCVADDAEFEVQVANSIRAEGDAGVTFWHLGPARTVQVAVRARSPEANVEGTGLASLDLALDVTRGPGSATIEVVAPSGRSSRTEVTVIASNAIATWEDGDRAVCRVGLDGLLRCDTGFVDAGVFVGAGGACAFTADSQVYCRLRDGRYERRFRSVREVVEVSSPCVLSRDGTVTCEQRDGGSVQHAGEWTTIECRNSACCALDREGRARCWGSHPYNLFEPTPLIVPSVSPTPREVYGLPDRYVRLSSGHKTFFAQDQDGGWWAASNRMGFPSPAPFRLPDATADTLKLDSPYYCIMGLESDGGAWVVEYAGEKPRTALDFGAPLVDFTAVGPGGSTFQVLTADGRWLHFDCR